jgi:hypothetical protein
VSTGDPLFRDWMTLAPAATGLVRDAIGLLLKTVPAASLS